MGRFIGRLKRGYKKAKEISGKIKTKVEQKEFRRGLDREQAMRKLEAKAERQVKFAKAQTKQLEAKTKLYRAAERAKEAKKKFSEQRAIKFKPAIDYASDFLRVTPSRVTPSEPPRRKAVKQKGYVVRGGIAYPMHKTKKPRKRKSQPKQKGIPGLDYL